MKKPSDRIREIIGQKMLLQGTEAMKVNHFDFIDAIMQHLDEQFENMELYYLKQTKTTK